MIKRLYPKYLKDKSDDEKNFSCLLDLLGEGWINNKIDSAFHKLWFDPSPIACNELYIYDQCLRAVNFSNDWLRDRRSNIHGDSSRRNVAGTLNEIMTAAMFKLGGYDVIIPSKNQRVYDVALNTGCKKEVRISCKAIGGKDSEIFFKEKMENVEYFCEQSLDPKYPLILMLNVTGEDYFKVSNDLFGSTFHKMYHQLKNAPQDNISIYEDKDYSLIAKKMGTNSLSENYKSYNFIAYKKMHPNEQLKVRDTFSKASADFIKKLPDVHQATNVISLLIGSFFDFNQAKKLIVEEMSKDENKHIDLVLLYRIQPIQEIEAGEMVGNSTCVEFNFIINPQHDDKNSFVNTHFGGALKLQFPLGQVSEEATKNQIMTDTGQILDLEGHYFHYKGKIIEKHVRDGEFQLTTKPNVSHSCEVIDSVSGKKFLITPRAINRTDFLII